jgi:hypothetical protein
LKNKLLLTLGITAILLSVVAFSFVKASSVETVQVSPLSWKSLIFNLNTGQKFTGSLSISGGSGNDVNFRITDPQGTTILDLGRVSQGKSFDFTAQASGAYTFYFDNTFSLLSTKTVSLTYDVGLPTVFGMDLGLFLIIIGVIVVLLLLVVSLAVVRYRKKNLSKTNQPPTPSSPPQPSLT